MYKWRVKTGDTALALVAFQREDAYKCISLMNFFCDTLSWDSLEMFETRINIAIPKRVGFIQVPFRDTCTQLYTWRVI